MNNDKPENLHSISLTLSNELKQDRIIEKFVKDNRINSVVIILNHKYKKKCFNFSIPNKREKGLEQQATRPPRSNPLIQLSPQHEVLLFG